MGKRLTKADKAWMRGFATAVTGVRDVLHEGASNIRMMVENNGFDLADFEGCDLADIDMECMREVFADDEAGAAGGDDALR